MAIPLYLPQSVHIFTPPSTICFHQPLSPDTAGDTAGDTADPSLSRGVLCPPGPRLCSGMRNLRHATLKFPVSIRNLSGPSWTSLTELEIWS